MPLIGLLGWLALAGGSYGAGELLRLLASGGESPEKELKKLQAQGQYSQQRALGMLGEGERLRRRAERIKRETAPLSEEDYLYLSALLGGPDASAAPPGDSVALMVDRMSGAPGLSQRLTAGSAPTVNPFLRPYYGASMGGGAGEVVNPADLDLSELMV